MTCKESTLSCGRLQLAALSTGDWSAEHPPVLCLHGWLDNAASFIPLMQQLPDTPMLAIDWPGHGHSQHLGTDSHYHFVDYVGDLFELINSQGWDRIHLLGHSMGGLIASVFAGTFPDKVRSLMMIEACGPMSWPEQEAPQILKKAVISRRKLADKQLTQHPSLAAAIAARRAAGDLDDASARLLVERGIQASEQGFVWRSDPRLRTFSALRMTEGQAHAFVDATTAPALVVYGTEGFQMVRQAVQQRAGLYAQLELAELAGGHHLHMSHAANVAKTLRNFLSLTD